MSSPSSPSPPPPPPTGDPPPPTGNPPPPPPPNPADTASANYFFGFVITFIVLLILFVGCGIGSWRRFRIVGTAWDRRLQDMEGSSFGGRKRGRRRLVRPVFLETWTHPKGSAHLAPAASEKGKWESVQPISAALVWSRSKLTMRSYKSNASESATPLTPGRRNDGSVRGVRGTLRSYVFSQRPRRDLPPRPPPVERPPPEAIQVAVMIAMPSPPSSQVIDGPSYVGHSKAGEYQIGVVRISWPSDDGP